MPTTKRPIQPKLKLQPGRASTALPVLEEDVQAAIHQALLHRGHIVLSTSEHRRRQRCPHCGEWVTLSGGRGTSEGIPDIFTTHPDWIGAGMPVRLWLGVEVKGPQTPVSTHQKFLHQLGTVVIARDVEMAVQAAAQMSRFWKQVRERS